MINISDVCSTQLLPGPLGLSSFFKLCLGWQQQWLCSCLHLHSDFNINRCSKALTCTFYTPMDSFFFVLLFRGLFFMTEVTGNSYCQVISDI